MSEHDSDLIPSEDIEENGRQWAYKEVDSRIHHWTRPLNEDEIDWDTNEVELAGTNVPVRVVSLELHDQWSVTGMETAGPDYPRPGFTETISDEFVYTTDELDDAVETVRQYISDLS